MTQDFVFLFQIPFTHCYVAGFHTFPASSLYSQCIRVTFHGYALAFFFFFKNIVLSISLGEFKRKKSNNYKNIYTIYVLYVQPKDINQFQRIVLKFYGVKSTPYPCMHTSRSLVTFYTYAFLLYILVYMYYLYYLFLCFYQ